MGSVEDGRHEPEVASAEEEQPASFEDLGIRLVAHTHITPLGKMRSWSNVTRLEWAFLLVSLLAVLTTVGLGIARLVSLAPHSDDRVFVYMLFLTAFFSMWYAVNGVLREQVYELLVYAVTAVVLTLYALLNYLDPETPRGDLKLARLVVACLLSVPLVAVSIKLVIHYWQSGELIFRTVGARPAQQTACRRVLTAQSLLKLDAQLALSTVLLVVHDSGGGGVTSTEAAVLATGCLLTMLWWLAAYVSLRWELRRLLLFVVVPTAVLEPAYIVWKLATESRPAGVVLQCEWAAGMLALIVRALLVACLLLCCLRGFGLGISEHMYPERQAAGGGAGGRPARLGPFSGASDPDPAQPPPPEAE